MMIVNSVHFAQVDFGSPLSVALYLSLLLTSEVEFLEHIPCVLQSSICAV